MSNVNKRKRRWEYYVMKRGDEFLPFWKELLSEKNRNLLVIMGLGFDPRMCQGLKALLDAGGTGRRKCLLIEYEEGANSPSKKYADLVEKNRHTLKKLIDTKGDIQSYKLQMSSSEGLLGIGRRANDIFNNLEELSVFTDIVVDISAMPRSIYFSIIAKLIFLIDQEYQNKNNQSTTIPNLHLLVAENVNLDRCIRQQGIDEKAICLHGFSGDLNLEGTANLPKIWLPVLGEGKVTQLKLIHEYLGRPSEICPILPSPSLNPRRADALLLQEYRELFFDEFQFESSNIIYASEQNLFEAYRQIHQTIIQYNEALQILGGCKAFISPLSSKILSIGSLLAAYEIRQSLELKKAGCRVGIAHVEAQGYYMVDAEEEYKKSELFTLWIAGECYEK
ncbi:MAG: hypothetical protein HWQ38_38110 [Nostoc sp. NMS7]|uniref:hypothetical protein n=1 Tax=Nostoc sp. NMS7 TaxID=2815391 RepID=UPI0025CEB578|nr:hypothetical protein [Nostoc sp. NMS7]MBN3951972.1 hypothetical protein [Nostoc sp. NMS7]